MSKLQKTVLNWSTDWPNRQIAAQMINGTLMAVTFLVIFIGYYNLPKQSLLY